ncbi:hypothetical protein ABZ917_17780 [Nonomuraea wenchangensis]
MNHHEEQERRAADRYGLRPAGARCCPRVVSGKRCLVSSRNTCVCQEFHALLDHGRMWRDRHGYYVLTGEPYSISTADLSAFTEVMDSLGLTVDVKEPSDSFWNPGWTHLIVVAGENRPTRAKRKPVVDWTAIEGTVKQRWNGERTYRNGSQRGFGIPSPTGGHFVLEVTLRPRWCSLAVDRWRTTDRRMEPSQAWFEEHAWPVVRKAFKARRVGAGFLPSGGGAFASASPIERRDLLDLMVAWVDAELTWGIPKEAS